MRKKIEKGSSSQTIKDEFTNLPVSRQRKAQLRMRRDDPDRYFAIQIRDNKRRNASKVAWAKLKKEKEALQSKPANGEK